MAQHTTSPLPDLGGAVALVTGATRGIGLRIAAGLAAAGAELIVPARSSTGARAAAESIRSAAEDARVETRPLDLSSRRSIDAFTHDLLRRRTQINILINNARITAPPRRLTTEDGFELQFGVNYLSHFLLTARLLPLLSAGRAHVVSQTSVLAKRGAINWGDLRFELKCTARTAYAQSKVAVGLFGLELQRRSEAHGWGISSDVAHPGITRTGFPGARAEPGGGAGSAPARIISSLSSRGIVFGDLDSAAEPALLAATTEGGGRLYGPSGFAHLRGRADEQKPFKPIADIATAARLWAATEDMTSLRFGPIAAAQ